MTVSESVVQCWCLDINLQSAYRVLSTTLNDWPGSVCDESAVVSCVIGSRLYRMYMLTYTVFVFSFLHILLHLITEQSISHHFMCTFLKFQRLSLNEVRESSKDMITLH